MLNTVLEMIIFISFISWTQLIYEQLNIIVSYLDYDFVMIYKWTYYMTKIVELGHKITSHDFTNNAFRKNIVLDREQLPSRVLRTVTWWRKQRCAISDFKFELTSITRRALFLWVRTFCVGLYRSCTSRVPHLCMRKSTDEWRLSHTHSRWVLLSFVKHCSIHELL